VSATDASALAAVFGPVSPPTAFEETVGRLGTAVRLGVLAPGSRLPPERQLAEQLHISRSTLRHAITALVEAGLLSARPGRGGGTFVTETPPLTRGTGSLGPDARDVLDRRLAVETGAVVLAGERAEPQDLRALVELVETMAAASSFERYRRADVRFHIALAEAARSPALVADMTAVQGQMTELIALIPHPETVLARSNEQHRTLIGLLADGEAGRAAELVRLHLAGTERLLEGLAP
jgi:DNA-binding FadR family transcriptional regulator